MMTRIGKSCAVVLACSIAAVAGGAPDTAENQPVIGTWQGTLPNPMGGQIRVVLHVTRTAEGVLSATMDSPDQNASGIPVAKITVEGQKVSLDVAAVGGSFAGTLDPEKKEISGTWRQSGEELPLVLKKEAAKR
jgi:hypothetical protein